MSLSFGTDGIRGVANTELDPELALRVGRAAVQALDATTFAVGRDPRRSGPMLSAALIAGMLSEGADVVDLGVTPTPAVAAEAASRGCAGAMLSASHNPAADNGIKLFGVGGRKLSDAVEGAVTAAMAAPNREAIPTGAGVGQVTQAEPVAWRELVRGAATGRLEGLTVVIDGANGAAAIEGPAALVDLGANVSTVATEPDGLNINDQCGSTDLGLISRTVVERGADLGLAFDGDADRLVAVDHQGQAVDGDRIIALLALDRQAQGRLPHDTVVVTVMTNLGFHRAMAHAGITVEATSVGDRNVLEALQAGGFALGGEQSGHVISADLAMTGDGVLTAVQLCDLLVRRDASLASLAGDVMTTVPQLLRNVRLERTQPQALEILAPAIAEAEAEMGSDGRVLVRLSGTEPLLRIMVEHVDENTAEQVCAQLVAQATELLTSR